MEGEGAVMKKRRILVPVDGSNFSRQIYGHILEFCPAEEVELILLRVAEVPAGRAGVPPRPASVDVAAPMYDSEQDLEQAAHPIYASQERDSMEAQIRHELQPDVHQLESAGYSVRLEIQFGDPAREIESYSQLAQVDLIAMTTHGRSGLSRLLLGSVAEHVVRHVPTPLLLFRPSKRH
jgi:nucleotide-binding universal stress UspA family protein